MRPSVWGEVIRPMLADRTGWATFIGTPKGRNAFHSVYERGLSDAAWFAAKLPASETGILPREELEDARRDMTPEQYDQEFECSFDAAILGAYYGKEIAELERLGRVVNQLYDPALPVHTAWDIGVSDSTAIFFFQVAFGELRVIDWYENSGYGAGHYVDVVNARPYKYGDHWLPHDVKVKEWGAGRTRVETLIELGIKPRLIPDHTVEDGINAARMTLNATWFDMACREAIELLRQYRVDYDEKLRAFKNKPRHDFTSHTADAFRYLAMAWKQIAPSVRKSYDQPKGIMDATMEQALKMQPVSGGRIR